MDDKKLYCLLRKTSVAALPEERVRQQLLHHMIHQLHFPASYLALEKALTQLPHLQLKNVSLPNRRADLICFGKNIHPKHELYPLLLVECKAVPLTDDVIHQVVGYNRFVQAYFVAIANADEIKTGWYDPALKNYRFTPSLPSYEQLLKAIKVHSSAS